jgi:hypothetical protein
VRPTADTPGTGPDFAALYPVDDDTVLTPRLAHVLCETAWYLADEWRLVDTTGPKPPRSDLVNR